MIIVRDVFDIASDRIGEAEPVMRGLHTVGLEVGLGPARVMIDRSASHFERAGKYTQFVVEREFPTTALFTERSSAAMADDRWMRAWTACKPFVRRARREILETIS